MPKYWFRPKQYGFGATPLCWQGWAWCAVPFVAVPALSWATAHIASQPLRLAASIMGIVVLMAVVLGIAAAKTDGKWRWRL